MIQITEYLTTKVSKSKIKATDKTIKHIVKKEMDKYGHDCDLNHIDVSKVTQMGNLFYYTIWTDKLKYANINPDISEWDVSNVANMEFMFYECESFNSNLSNWNVSNVTNMDHMFDGCTNFNKDISKWDVSNVKNYRFMFDNCPIEEKYKPHF